MAMTNRSHDCLETAVARHDTFRGSREYGHRRAPLSRGGGNRREGERQGGERGPPRRGCLFEPCYAQGTSSSSGSGSTSSPTTRAFHCPSHLGHSNITVGVGAVDPRQESVSPCGNRLPNQLQLKWGHFTR